MFYLAEYMALVTNSAIFATLFLGGPDGPAIAGHSIGPFWFAMKVLVLLYVYMWIRATLPRLRYDQLMDLGWKRLIPASLALLLIVAGARVRHTARWLARRSVGQHHRPSWSWTGPSTWARLSTRKASWPKLETP